MLLELLEQVAKPTADHAAGGAACKEAAQSTLEQIAKTTTRSAAGKTRIDGARVQVSPDLRRAGCRRDV